MDRRRTARRPRRGPARRALALALGPLVLGSAASGAPPAALPEGERRLALVAPEERPTPLVQLLDHGVRVEGRALARSPGTSPARWGDVWLLPLRPIARALGNRLDVDGDRIVVVRAQDGAVFALDRGSGEVRVNGEPLGYAPVVDVPDDDGALLLPLEAVEVMTGTHVFLDERAREFVLRLDERLRESTGFEVRVEGRPLLALDPEPRAIGSVLLLPLRPILEALGGRLELDPDGRRLTVVRAQDRAVIRLDLDTGIAVLDEEPIGIVRDLALADREQLLLPSDAVALLTGTHVAIEAATQVVHVELDPALAGILAPGGRILDEAGREPLTFESVDYHLGNDVTNRLRLRARHRRFDYGLRYETPDVMRPDRPEPSFYQLSVRSLRGPVATLGESTAVRRELSGIGVSRIRGGALSLPILGRESRFVVGQPLSGRRVLSGGRTVPAYAGWAVGGRVYGEDDRFELGLSGGTDREGGRGGGALGMQHRIAWSPVAAIEGDHFQALDVGWFTGSGTGRRPDVRLGASSRLALGERVTSRVRLAYDGVDFRRSAVADLPEGDPDAPAIEPPPGSDRLESQVELGVRLFAPLDTRLRYAFARERLLAGDADDGRSVHALTSGFQWTPLRRGPILRSDYTLSSVDAAVAAGIGHTWRGSLSHEAWGGRAVAQQLVERGPLERDSSQLALTRPLHWQGPRAARLALGPTLTGVHETGASALDGSLAVGIDSGRWLGRRADLAVDYALTESLLQSAERERFGRHFFNLALGFLAFPWARFELQYRDDFEGERRVFLSLRGSHDQAATRRHRRARPGTGVLAGRLFLDRDRDGVQQADEPGLAGVPVRLRRTGLALRTDRSGAFTIQNLEAGVYELEVGEASLPLGLGVPAGPRRLRVDDGRITRVGVGARVLGQLRGRVFADRDGSGRFEPGERGLEGVRLRVEPGDRQVYTSAFGLFALEGLPPGRYAVRVDPAYLPGAGDAPERPGPVEVELRDGAMQQQVELPVPAATAPAASERAALPGAGDAPMLPRP